MTFASLKEKHIKTGGYSTGFICDGAKFVGCKMTDLTRTDPNEELYHCAECNFDSCAKCTEVYGETHIHGQTKMTFAELVESSSAYEAGWACDCRHYQGCPYGGKLFHDDYGLVYHDPDCGFDLCEKCAVAYRL